MKATNIRWDTDGDKRALASLPTEVKIPFLPNEFDSFDEFVDEVSDYLSDEYGFCHNGFNIESEE